MVKPSDCSINNKPTCMKNTSKWKFYSVNNFVFEDETLMSVLDYVIYTFNRMPNKLGIELMRI